METSRNYRRRAPGFVRVNWRRLGAGSIPSPSPPSLQPPQQLQMDPGWILPAGPGSTVGWRARKTSARLTSAWEFGIPCAQRKRQLCEPVPPGGNRRMCYGRASVPISLVWCCGSSDVTLLLPLLLFPAFKSTPSLPPRGDRGFIITSCLLGKRDRIYRFSRDQSGARAPVLHAGKTHWHRDRVTERKPCSKVCILSTELICAREQTQ